MIRRNRDCLHANAPTDYEELYRSHVDRVLSFARQLTGNQADAEDLTQEVFLAAFKGLSRFSGRSTIQTWLLAIAVRRWRDDCRKKHPLTAEDWKDTILLRPHTVSACDTMAEHVVSAIVLDAAISRLNPPLREAFLLVAGQKMTHREAAHLLGAPVGTVKWRVAEALRQLRVTLAEESETANEQ